MIGATEVVGEIEAGPRGPQIVAFFDFDGTIVDGHSIATFYQQRILDRDVNPMELIHLLVVAAPRMLDEDGFVEFVERAVGVWAGRDEDDLMRFGRRLLVKRLGANLFPGAWTVVKAHQRMGHTVVMASAASRFQVEPLGDELDVDHVLCTRLETREGRLTGRLDGPPLWGRRKADAVKAFADERGLDLDECYAYGNGDEDIAFLDVVGRPHAVNPASRLAAHAEERDWPTVRFTGRGRPDVVRLARTIAAFGMTATAGTAGAALGLLNRDRRQGFDLAFGLMGDLTCAVAGIDLAVHGREHLWSHRPAVFIFNHQSTIDAPVMMKLLREGFTGLAEGEMAHAPGVGQFFRWADVASVERLDTERARRTIAPAIERLDEGISVVIAPEGTRSPTPKLGPFNTGAFHVAMQAGVPIVPVVIRNAGEIAWRNSFVVQPGTVDVVVLPPISVDDWTVDDLDDRVADVRQRYLDTLANWPRSGAP